MNNLIKESTTLKYRVVVDNMILNESLTSQMAEQFIMTLLPEQRSKARIVPITEDGNQVLLG